MNKNDLIAKVSLLSGFTKVDAERAIDGVLASITESLKEGHEIRLIGFGTFTVAERPATEGRNPRTGEPLKIPATRLPKFRAGKQLKEAVSG